MWWFLIQKHTHTSYMYTQRNTCVYIHMHIHMYTHTPQTQFSCVEFLIWEVSWRQHYLSEAPSCEDPSSFEGQKPKQKGSTAPQKQLPRRMCSQAQHIEMDTTVSHISSGQLSFPVPPKRNWLYMHKSCKTDGINKAAMECVCQHWSSCKAM